MITKLFHKEKIPYLSYSRVHAKPIEKILLDIKFNPDHFSQIYELYNTPFSIEIVVDYFYIPESYVWDNLIIHEGLFCFGEYFVNKTPNTLQEFISDLYRANVSLAWQKDIIKRFPAVKI